MCVIPVYNNQATVRQVALDCRKYVENVLVVDDGSTDVDIVQLFSETDIEVIRHDENRGKGQALLTGLKAAEYRKADWMLIVDADGQHKAEDIPKFLALMQGKPEKIIIGARDFTVENIPDSSRFGRLFSNFWVKRETGVSLSDSQSGFRAYPVDMLTNMNLSACYFDFEIEVLVKALWHGLKVQEVPIKPWYAPREERVTRFDPWKDNLRLTWMHTRLIGRRLSLWPYKKLVRKPVSGFGKLFRNPKSFLSHLFKENSTPIEIAVAAGLGVILATLPLIWTHIIIVLYVTTRLSLNRIIALSVQILCPRQIVPLACIELGHFIRNGSWLDSAKTEAVLNNFHHHLGNWFLGSLIITPILGILIGFLTYYLANQILKIKKASYRPLQVNT
ncbi:MAG: DUF2062 domain-containing protein [Sedimentisphaerales bacterium]|nr:DUF2062 domain-containing protein [Sedimentisphaerales bacterium]